MEKVGKKVFLVIVSIIVVYLLLCRLAVWKVDRAVKSSVHFWETSEGIQDGRIHEGEHTRKLIEDGSAKMEHKFFMLLSICSLNKGYVWFNYKKELQDTVTNEKIWSSDNIPLRVTIELRNGQWIITDYRLG